MTTKQAKFRDFFNIDWLSERLKRLVYETLERIPKEDQAELARERILLEEVPRMSPEDKIPARCGCVRFKSQKTGFSWEPAYQGEEGAQIIVHLISDNLSQEEDEMIKGFIAHEFAHIFLKHLDARKTPKQISEPEADRQAVIWGFPTCTLQMAEHEIDEMIMERLAECLLQGFLKWPEPERERFLALYTDQTGVIDA